MRMKLISVGAVLVLAAGCGSGSSEDPSASEFTPSYGDSVSVAPGEATADSTTAPAPTQSAAPSNIVNQYDTATCRDWAVTDATNRRIVTVYFLVRTKSDDLTDFEETVEESITTACAVTLKNNRIFTVKRVAEASIEQTRKALGGN